MCKMPKRPRYATSLSARRKAPAKRRRLVSTASSYGGGYRTGGYRNRVGSARGRGLQELKFFDDKAGPAAINDTWTTVNQSLNQVTQGANAYQRIGRCIYLRSLHIRGVVTAIQDAIDAETTCGGLMRLVIVLDTQCNGAAAAAADIWDAMDSAGPAAVLPVNQLRNLEKSSRFRVVYDRMMNLNQYIAGQSTNTMSGEKQVPFKLNKKLNLKLEFDSSTGGIGDLTSNNLAMFAVREGGYAVSLSCVSRIRFDG